MARVRSKVAKAGRRAVARGERPRYRVELDGRVAPDVPWLEFDGDRPAAIAEAARRAIAAELSVRPDQVEVEPIEPSDVAMPPVIDALERGVAVLEGIIDDRLVKLESLRRHDAPDQTDR